MNQKPPTCVGCPAEHIGRGYVPGIGPLDATIAVVGQGPGEVEAAMGEPFVGPIGQRMRDWLARAAINPHSVWLDNVARCHLPKNREPSKAERAHCTAAHLMPQLRKLRERGLRVVVAVGLPSAKSLLREEKITTAVVGTVERRTL